MITTKSISFLSPFVRNHVSRRTFSLTAVNHRRRIKHPTYQFFPYQKYDTANPMPHRDRVPVWNRLQITTKMASEHKVGGTKLWHAMYMAHRGVQMPGYFDHETGKFVYINEMVPEFVVPDLTNFKLKPYVAYNVSEIKQDQFLAKDLFNSTYAAEVVEDFKQGKYKTEEKLTVKDPQSSSES